MATLTQVSEVYQDDDFFLGQPSLVKADAEGNLYVGDNSTLKIHVFNADGEHLYELGGKGTGPGEFNGFGISAFWLTADGSLQVYDNNTRRMSIFRKTDGRYAYDRSFTVESPQGSRGFPMQLVPISTDTYIATFTRFSMENTGQPLVDPVHRFGTDGVPTDSSLVKITGMEMYMSQTGNSIMIVMKPFSNRTLIESFADGTFLSVWTGTAGAKIYDANGEFVREFSFPVDAEPVTQADRDRIRDSENPQAEIMLANMPDFKNIVNEVMIASNNDVWLWIGTRDKNHWLVFDSNGTPLRQVQSPEGVTIRYATDTRVYGVNMNEATVGVWEIGR